MQNSQLPQDEEFDPIKYFIIRFKVAFQVLIAKKAIVIIENEFDVFNMDHYEVIAISSQIVGKMSKIVFEDMQQDQKIRGTPKVSLMNHITQLNRLLELEQNYQAFMPFCPPDKVDALTLELTKLDLRIRKINGMNIEKSLTEVPFFFETKQSKANFKTI